MHPIADRQHHIKIEKLLGSFHIAISFLLNYLKICDSWNILQFFLQSIVNMFSYCFLVTAEKNGHLTTVQPNGFLL